MKKITISKKTATRKPTRAKSARRTVRPKTAKAPVAPPVPVAVKVTKKDAVLALLRREDGATLAEPMSATGWQAHSVRGFISGALRRKLGGTVMLVEMGPARRAYRIVQA
jgi:hypothetical protein